MAVPKKKTSKSRRDMRRSHLALSPVESLAKCENCGNVKMYHHMCPSCGFYRGRQIKATQKTAR